MTRLFIVLSSMALAVLAYGNNDSLHHVINDPGIPDTSRFKAVRSLAESYLYTDPDSNAYYADMLMALADRMGTPVHRGGALMVAGQSNYMRGEFDIAMDQWQQGREIMMHAGDSVSVARFANNIGKVHHVKGDLPSAIAEFSLCLRIHRNMQDSLNLAVALNNMGNVLRDQGNYSRAMEHYSESLRLMERLGKDQGIAFAWNNIGTIHQNQGEHRQAKECFERCYEHLKKAGDKYNMAKALSNIGNSYHLLKEQQKAIQYNERSLALLEELDDKHGVAITLISLGTIHDAIGEHERALERFRKSLDLAQEIGDQNSMGAALTNIGIVHSNIGRPVEAIPYCERALEMGRASGNAVLVRNASGELAHLHRSLGDFKTAYTMYELHIQMRDSILSEENRDAVMQQRFQYDYEKKEALLQAEQEKKDALAQAHIKRRETQRNASIGGFTLMLLLAGVFFTQRNHISREKQRSDELLLNILPHETAQELKEKGYADARQFEEVTVLFTDFKGFTSISEQLTPKELVASIDECFKVFDNIIGKYGIEKIKTIGDAYMAAGGLPSPGTTDPALVVNAALDIRDWMVTHKQVKGDLGFEVRIGIHTGPVVAGIVGIKKFAYDIWGDTVNTASRMESSGEAGMVNISHSTYEKVKDRFQCEYRGEIDAKGKGKVKMYFVERA